MFKRANKITALLVAAASIMSVVPAMAADTSTTSTKLESKDGNITNAVAFQDGKYVYQGYKSSDSTDAIYYNAGDQDKALDDVANATLNDAYADKYAYANDGSDQYLVDLTSGDVTDNSTPVDDADTAATKLQTHLKKASRYGSDVTVDAATNLGATSDVNSATLPGNKFGDAWYSYDVTTNSSDAQNSLVNSTSDANGKTGHLYGFTDATGKYVDASYLANIYAYSTKQGKTVKISNYSNSMDDVDSDSGLLVTLMGQPVALTQDKDYIYALATVAVTDTATNAVITDTATNATTDAAATGIVSATADSTNAAILATSKTTVRTYVQKIAKAQGDQKDDAYLPKTVESYEVGNSTSEFNCSNATDAYSEFTAVLGSDLTKVTQADAVYTSSDNALLRPKFTIVNGNLVIIKADGGNVDAATINFKQDKLKFDVTPGYKTAATTTAAGSYNLDNKVDVYMMEKDSDDSVDINNTTDEEESYDIDADGNVWVIADGKIYEYTNGSMTKVYTCDSSLDAISVYDQKSLVAWATNGDVYTTVTEGTADQAATTTAATTAATTTKTGWDQLADGTWNFYDATGAKVVNNWTNVGGVWYYLKADGVMATGWVNDNGTWYFLASSGAMKTGWVNDNGTWYYLNASGAMLANTTVDGYVLGASGAWLA